MRRGAKPAKAKVEAKLTVAPKSGKIESARIRDLGRKIIADAAELRDRVARHSGSQSHSRS